MIRLREPKGDDLVPMTALFNDPSWHDMVPIPYRPVTGAQVLVWFQSWQTPVHILFVITDLRDKPIGFGQLMHIDIFNAHCEGAVVLDKAHRNGLYGKAAIVAMEEFCKNTLHLRKVWVRISDKNKPAIRLVSALGYNPVGTLRDHMFSNGQWHNVMVMERFLL